MTKQDNNPEINWQAMWSAAYTRQAAKIRQIEASGQEASDEEYTRLFQLEDGMKGMSL